LPAQICTIIETFIARSPNKVCHTHRSSHASLLTCIPTLLFVHQVIDYLLTQDSCHFVDCIINRLHQVRSSSPSALILCHSILRNRELQKSVAY
jgi:hypothetical protein